MGRPDVGQMLSEISADQLDWWMVWYGMGNPRRAEEIAVARILHQQASIYTGKNDKPPLFVDLLPEAVAYEVMLEERARNQASVEKMSADLRAWGESLKSQI